MPNLLPIDLILLDLMLPKLNGIELCKRLRMAGCGAYVLMLTARDTTRDKVIGLDAGADDYLGKPFELEELEARIRALSRRYMTLQPSLLQHEYLQLDPSTRQVTYQGTLLSLTPREYMMLDHLLRQPTQIFTRPMLIDKLWEYDQTVGEETIKTHMVNLRRKLKAAGSKQELIETVYGIGYRLRPI